MNEHNKTYYSLEELKRARDCYEGYQDGEEVYYFVGALRYACDEIERLKEEYMMLQNASDEVEEEKDREIERLNNIIKEVREYITNWHYRNDFRINSFTTGVKEELLEILDKGVDKE